MRYDCIYDPLCARCGGSGRIECPYCDDGYTVVDSWAYTDEPIQIIVYCDVCGGSTKIDCPDCGGSGQSGQSEEVSQ